jgi:hypothetical protein
VRRFTGSDLHQIPFERSAKGDVGDVASMWGNRTAYSAVVRTPEGRSLLGRPGRRWGALKSIFKR